MLAPLLGVGVKLTFTLHSSVQHRSVSGERSFGLDAFVLRTLCFVSRFVLVFLLFQCCVQGMQTYVVSPIVPDERLCTASRRLA